ncbi:MAG: cyclase family protein [Chloroflexota bacterium]
MARQIYDLSRLLSPSLAPWPGDTPFSIEKQADMDRGEPVNLTTLTFSSHLGTHVDAPYHFVNGDLTLEQVPLEIYVGPATVATVERRAGPLTPADFPGLDWARVERLLVHSAASDNPLDKFVPDFVYPSPEMAEWLGRRGVVLFGSDAPSMDAFNSDVLAGHLALRRHNIAILEGLLFKNVPDGEYELIALPLKIQGGDGSPVRAILRRELYL